MILVSRNEGQELFKDYIVLFEKKQRQIQETCEKRLNKTHIAPWSTYYAEDLFGILFYQFGSKCAFCEQLVKLDKGKQESGAPIAKRYEFILYRNRHDYPWMIWQWPNWYLSCGDCYDAWKKSSFELLLNDKTQRVTECIFDIEELNRKEKPVILDPCWDNPEQFFRYENKGTDQIIPVPVEHPEENQVRAATTIRVFGLDRRIELGRARETTLENFERDFFRPALDSQSNNAIVALKNECENKKSFAGMKRFYLRQWLQKHKDSTQGPVWEILRDQLQTWREEKSKSIQPFPPVVFANNDQPEEENDPVVSRTNGPRIDWGLIPLVSRNSCLEKVLQQLFADDEEIIIDHEFASGFSGARVFQVSPMSGGRAGLSCVVKYDQDHRIHAEYLAFDNYIKSRVSDIANIEAKPAKLGCGYSGLRYPLGGGGVSQVTSLKNFIQEADAADSKRVVGEDLFENLKKLWSTEEKGFDRYNWRRYAFLLPKDVTVKCTNRQELENVDEILTPDSFLDKQAKIDCGTVVKLEGFLVKRKNESELTLTAQKSEGGGVAGVTYRIGVESVNNADRFNEGKVMAQPIYGRVSTTRNQFLREAVKKLFSEFDPNDANVLLPDGEKVDNPLLAVDSLLNTRRLHVKGSPIHGDLNLENVLVKRYKDGQPKGITLIDFASARKDHVLHDFLRLETGLWLYIVSIELQRINNNGTLKPFFNSVHVASKSSSHPLSSPNLKKPYYIIREIREQASHYLRVANKWQEYFSGLTLYMLGALKFKNLDEAQKQLAFWLACLAYDCVKGGCESSGSNTRDLTNDDTIGGEKDSPPVEEDKTDTLNLLHQVEIRKKIQNYFNMNELETLCHDLLIEYDNLKGTTLEAKVLELVKYCNRHDKLGDLINHCEIVRPKINWRD